MRLTVLVLLVLELSIPALAATRQVTVKQLEEFLAAARDRRDAVVASQLAELELTERLSEVRHERLDAALPGPLSHQALLILADSSELLNLPREEIPAGPPPELKAQVDLYNLAVHYAVKTISGMPNFYATRETSSFEDEPMQPARDVSENLRPAMPLHFENSFKVTVFIRSGHESLDEGEAAAKKTGAQPDGLTTAGEFGPVLSTVLLDAAHGKVIWSHWEQGALGRMAVFRFTVPKTASHYSISALDPWQTLQQNPAYHGEIAINPVDGSILRVTMQADLQSTDRVIRAGLMVAYGPVVIGGKTYICPVKSVALSQAPLIYTGTGRRGERWVDYGPPQTRVNDVHFTDYHLFRAEIRMLSGNAKPDRNPDATSSPPQPQQ